MFRGLNDRNTEMLTVNRGFKAKFSKFAMLEPLYDAVSDF